ncbi:MAG: FG-GAP-like repeat-containing protein, partial [Kiritimatiellae bacterium]|nr:FG-GAP-like repeat-containing protein [Kiritimatiellia bacterium]
DGRVFIAGRNGGTIRMAYSDDQGQSWSAEIDTGVEQGNLAAQIAFVPDGANNYYVYSSSCASTNRGEDGSWFLTRFGSHTPFPDPNVSNMLYLSSDELGLGYSTNALSTETNQNNNGDNVLEIYMDTYSYGIEAVKINDFTFTTNKTVGWSASGQGIRWTTNLNETPVIWSEPIMPDEAPSYHAVAIDPNEPSGCRIYAADNRNVYRSEAGFTTDTSAWTRIFRPGFDTNGTPLAYCMGTVRRMAVKPGDSNVIVVGYSYEPPTSSTNDINGLMFSEDYGANWTNLLFNGNQLCDIRDLLFSDGQLYIAASYNDAYPANSGVFRVDTENGWTVTHEISTPFHARGLAVESDGTVWVSGIDTNAGLPVLYQRDSGTGLWTAPPMGGLPASSDFAVSDNALIAVGLDEAGDDSVLFSYKLGLYSFRGDQWVRIYDYPNQTALYVLRWDELTLGSGSGLYAQETPNLLGRTLYVSLAGSHTSPYTNWTMAATNIQAALDAASPGDVVLVADGTYEVGGAVAGGMANRVSIPSYVTLRSQNGYAGAIISGARDNGTNGPDAVRGAYVPEYAVLDGFTLQGGGTHYAADPDDAEDDPGVSGGGVLMNGGTMKNCLVTGNSGMQGAGVTISQGGGTVQDSRIAQNEGVWGGGGVMLSTGIVANCEIIQNTADGAGGVFIDSAGTLRNCLVQGNSATDTNEYDGGALVLEEGGTVENCTITRNITHLPGGAAVRSLENDENPSMQAGVLLNTIVQHNVAPGAPGSEPPSVNIATDIFDSITFCCAPELSHGSNGNSTNDPQFAGATNFSLQTTSPCINAGENKAWMTNAPDLIGNARIIGDAVDMGAYEYPLAVSAVQARAAGLTVLISWQTITGAQGYRIYRSTNSASQGSLVASPAAGTAAWTDSNVTKGEIYYYTLRALYGTGVGDASTQIQVRMQSVYLDFDGDGKADIAVYWPEGGQWSILQSGDNTTRIQDWGWSEAQPVPGDYDGDGKADVAVYCAVDGQWVILQSATMTLRSQAWGWSEALPVPADYDGDGITDIAVYWPEGGQWTILQSSDNTTCIQDWGWSEAQPVPGDYDGDGLADIAVYSALDGQWMILQSSTMTLRSQAWGWSEAEPVQGDYDGDGKTDVAVYLPENGGWSAYLSGSGQSLTRNWGWSEAWPVPADYDGDSIGDFTVYSPNDGLWSIWQSGRGGARIQSWGWNEAIPVNP